MDLSICYSTDVPIFNSGLHILSLMMPRKWRNTLRPSRVWSWRDRSCSWIWLTKSLMIETREEEGVTGDGEGEGEAAEDEEARVVSTQGILAFYSRDLIRAMTFLESYIFMFWFFLDPSKILFVKNLSYNTTNDSLAEAFEGCSTARVAMERDNPGRSRG